MLYVLNTYPYNDKVQAEDQKCIQGTWVQ